MNGGHIREPLMVERDTELEGLDTVLSSISDGVGRLVVLEGPPGIGKSTLLAVAARVAAERRFRVLSARGHPIESDLSFGIARQLFERTVAGMSEDERSAALSGAASLATSVIGSAPGVEYSMFPAMHGLYWLAANLAEECPLLLLIDDAHWADDASLRWLTYLATRLADVPAVVLVARWPRTVGPGSPLLDALSGEPAAEVMSLRELSRAGVGELARRVTGSDLGARALGLLYERTGGNPFFVQEVLIAEGDDGEPVVPSNVARFASARVGALSADGQELAAAAAVLGPETTLALAADVAALSTSMAEAAHDELARASIFSRSAHVLEFVHPLVREAVYSDLAPGQRATLHRRAAAALGERNADVERRANHLLNTTPAADPTVIQLLTEAAARARSRGDNQAASGYLRRACDEGGPPAADHTLWLELGRTLSLWNPTAAVDVLESALGAAPDADARLLVAIELAQARSRLADLAGAYHVLEQALAEPHPRTDPDLLLVVEGGLLTTGGLAPTLVRRSLERLKTISPPAGNTPGERLLLSGIVRVRMTGPDPWDGLVELTRRAIGGGEIVTDTAPDAGTFSTVTWPLLQSGHFEEATELIEAFFADGARRGSMVNVALATHLLGIAALLRGNINAALEHTERAIELSLSSGYFIVLLSATAHRMRALIHAGRIDDAEGILKTYGFDGDIADIALLFHTVLRARAELRLAQGRAEDAWQDIQDLGRRHTEFGIDEESLAWRPIAAEAALALGRAEQAASIATAEWERARRKGVIAAEGRAQIMLGRAVGGTDGLNHLREAARLLSTTSFDLDRARALAELGSALIRSNQRAEAKQPLLEALDLAGRLGATVLATSIADDLATCGARPRRTALTGRESLTPSEFRVAELAAQGHTNVEIAQRLFVTRKSVEFHLTNSYRKLQVGSRRELASALGGTAAG